MRIDDSAVLWSAPERERPGRPLIVLLHGFGSHEGDLFALSRQLPLDPVVASVRAPIPEGQGFAWFPRGGASPETERWEIAAKVTLSLIDWLDTTRSTSVGLLGFSQGAAMSLELMREQPERFDYAVALSGFVLPEERPADSRLAEIKPPVFWGRGTADEVIPHSLIAYTQDWLPRHATVTERIYEGVGHFVTGEEISDFNGFIREQLESPRGKAQAEPPA